MELEKIFKHLNSLSDLSVCKVSANADDTSYITGDTVVAGDPWLRWNNICYIDSPACIWTHGVLYRCDELKTLAFDLQYDDTSVLKYDTVLSQSSDASKNADLDIFTEASERGVYLCNGDDSTLVLLTNVDETDSSTVMYGHFLSTDAAGAVDAYAKITIAGDAVECVITSAGSSSKYEMVLNDDGSLQCVKNNVSEGFTVDSDGALSLA